MLPTAMQESSRALCCSLFMESDDWFILILAYWQCIWATIPDSPWLPCCHLSPKIQNELDGAIITRCWFQFKQAGGVEEWEHSVSQHLPSRAQQGLGSAQVLPSWWQQNSDFGAPNASFWAEVQHSSSLMNPLRIWAGAFGHTGVAGSPR